MFPYGFSQDHTTAIYSVYVTHRDFLIPMLPNTAVRAWDFKAYRLYVLFNFIPLPTPDMGTSSLFETSPQITDGVPDGDSKSRLPRGSFSFVEFQTFHFHVVRNIAAKLAQNVLEDYKRAGLEASTEIIRGLADLSQQIQPLPVAVKKSE